MSVGRSIVSYKLSICILGNVTMLGRCFLGNVTMLGRCFLGNVTMLGRCCTIVYIYAYCTNSCCLVTIRVPQISG